MASFLDLQNGFYNAFTQGLGLPPGSAFQLSQPSPPLMPGVNQDVMLWNYFNQIPPFTLTSNYQQSGGNEFFTDYSGLLSALNPAQNSFEQDVGTQCSNDWWAYVGATPSVLANRDSWADVFQGWAAVHGYISVADVGAGDLAALILDPIASAQTAALLYKKKQPDWIGGYAELTNALANAPSRNFTFNSATQSSNVSNTWCNGNQSSFFGLWSNSSSSSSQSETFSSAGVTVDANLKHVTTFTAVPGAWYSSSALADAFSTQSGSLWKSGSSINWTNTFDPNKGNLTRFAASIVVASGMYIKVESAASFSQSDRTEISNANASGMWPFYSSNSNSGTNTAVSFNNNGNMTVIITSAPGIPIVLGVNVVPIGTFVGHALKGAQLRAAALRQAAE